MEENKKEPVRIHQFWVSRTRLATLWGLLLTISNSAFQLNAILYPLNEAHLSVNIAYMANSILCLALFFISIVKPGYTYLAFIGFSLTLFRNEMRGLDLEQTYDPNDLRTWMVLTSFQLFLTAINISIMTNNFNYH